MAALLFALVDSESGPCGRANVRNRLKFFLDRYGDRILSTITPDDLVEYKGAMVKGRRPESTNNYLSATRRLLTLAYETGKVEYPFRLSWSK